MSHVSPGWFVRCCIFPCGDVDVKVLEVSFQGVFEALALSSYLPSPLDSAYHTAAAWVFWSLTFGRRDLPSVSVPCAWW